MAGLDPVPERADLMPETRSVRTRRDRRNPAAIIRGTIEGRPMPDESPTLRLVEIDGIGCVWLREGTSDYAVLDQIFRTEEFNISTA